MKAPSYSVLLPCLVLSLTGCEDIQKIEAEHAALATKLNQLHQQQAEIDGQLLQLRRFVPPGATPEQAAHKMAASNAQHLLDLDAKLTKSVQAHQQAEATLAALEKDLADLRSGR